MKTRRKCWRGGKCLWLAGLLAIAVGALEAAQPGDAVAIRFELPVIKVRPGKVVEVPFGVHSAAPLSMVAFSFEYDPMSLLFLGADLSPQAHAILERKPFLESQFQWFADPEAGWVQASLVFDYEGEEDIAIPPGILLSVIVLRFSVANDAPGKEVGLTFTRLESAGYPSHFQGSHGPVYNAARPHGRPFTPEDQFDDPGDPELIDGLAIIGDVGIFVRGDANMDNLLDISDPVYIVGFLFLGEGQELLPCEDAADANDDGEVDISDPIKILEFLFVDGSATRLFASEPVVDETPDSLACGDS